MVLETSKKSIPESIDRLRFHEKIMSNYVDLYERAKFAQRGSHKDKFLGIGSIWLKFIVETGSEQRFPNNATASNNAIESARILMRSRQDGVKLVHSVAWDQIRFVYLSTRGAGSEKP